MCTRTQRQQPTPIKFGGRVVNEALLLHVSARVETRDGRQGEGFGSMPMGNVRCSSSILFSSADPSSTAFPPALLIASAMAGRPPAFPGCRARAIHV